jgi:hypothetical protein
MYNLHELKETIESMAKHHQIEILRILHSRPNVPFNENKNGTFINLTSLSPEDIELLYKYSEYVKAQQTTITIIETKKKNIQHKYFNDNKDKNIISNND